MYQSTILKKEVTIDKLVSMHYFAYSKQFKFEGEKHEFWEIVCCDSGEVEINDEDTKYILPPSTAFLHAPNHFHNVRPFDKYANVTILSFFGDLGECANLCGKIIPLSAHDKLIIKNILSEGRLCFSDPLDIVYQPQLTVLESAPYGALQIIKNNLENFIVSLYRNIIKSNNIHIKQDGKSQNYFEYLSNQIIELLKTNLENKITLSDICSKLGYSPTYIKKIFKDTTGSSIIHYYISLKIESAKQLIAESTLTISQISEKLGFDSLQYFSRQFRKYTNMSPTEYVKSVKLDGIL